MSTDQGGKQKTILIADDDPGIVDALAQFLEEVGYAVRTTVDATTIGRLADGPPDLILLDIRMSGRDGSEICKRLKSADATRAIPIIIFSASKDTERIAREAGADDFIAKPFDMYQLIEKIERYV
jgi:DNA-binding response OmpR family regulator